MFVDSELKFGASTRSYIVREKPQLNKHAINPSAILNNSSANNSIVDVLNESGTGLDKEDSFSLLTSLPESEVELDVRGTSSIFFFVVAKTLSLTIALNIKRTHFRKLLL